MNRYYENHKEKDSFVFKQIENETPKSITDMNIKDKKNTFYIKFFKDDDYCSNFFDVYKVDLESHEIVTGGLPYYYFAYYEVLYYYNLDLPVDDSVVEPTKDDTTIENNPTTSSTTNIILVALLSTFYFSLLLGMYLKFIKESN